MDSTTTGRPCVCVLLRGVKSCPVSATWYPSMPTFGQSTTAASRHRCDMTVYVQDTLNPTNKQTRMADFLFWNDLDLTYSWWHNTQQADTVSAITAKENIRALNITK